MRKEISIGNFAKLNKRHYSTFILSKIYIITKQKFFFQIFVVTKNNSKFCHLAHIENVLNTFLNLLIFFLQFLKLS